MALTLKRTYTHIYSLGVVFYELLTGELPLGRFSPPSSKVEVDVRLDEVVLKSLAKEPERRYQHASEVKTDIDEIQDDELHGRKTMATTPASVQTVAGSKPRSAGFWIVMILVVVGSLGCLGILGVLFLSLFLGISVMEEVPIEKRTIPEAPPLPAPELPGEEPGAAYEEQAREELGAEPADDAPVPLPEESGNR